MEDSCVEITIATPGSMDGGDCMACPFELDGEAPERIYVVHTSGFKFRFCRKHLIRFRNDVQDGTAKVLTTPTKG